MYQVKSFKGCYPQIPLDPFLSILSYIVYIVCVNKAITCSSYETSQYPGFFTSYIFIFIFKNRSLNRGYSNEKTSLV